ncbi:uncharacterized protein BO72DRAFT_524346 [Aspergillus fijiensis CBS 313.89]|uniref:Beta/gamma crystallin 'Greek key' domain-containing protein n=1 Tax=Aspergillus fijiensis CBS 313.89 TaxID=1448319 RepID=A0A8G1RYU7_9EURO|nr:uncharacterized protein BO72DRAFT_524346 [Aspergillus fijiensis CBS 313.89]RAK81389.1 hypothetical protein BO72DRAFT_524346 [Aspergillus fijiensis CBS 313.89]
MLAIKSLSLSLGTLLLAAVSSAMEWTTVGYETTEGSRSMQVPLNDCWKFSEEEVNTVFLSRPCRLFTAIGCTGRSTMLNPGLHTSSDPIPFIDSIECY